MQYVGLILPIRIQYVCIVVFFQFKAFHVIRTSFIFYLFFNIRGSECSFMRLSYHAVLIHCDVFKAIFTERTWYKCYVLWFLPLRCHTFTLYRPHIVRLMPYMTVFQITAGVLCDI